MEYALTFDGMRSRFLSPEYIAENPEPEEGQHVPLQGKDESGSEEEGEFISSDDSDDGSDGGPLGPHEEDPMAYMREINPHCVFLASWPVQGVPGEVPSSEDTPGECDASLGDLVEDAAGAPVAPPPQSATAAAAVAPGAQEGSCGPASPDPDAPIVPQYWEHHHPTAPSEQSARNPDGFKGLIGREFSQNAGYLNSCDLVEYLKPKKQTRDTR
ncbi:hypothetical protein TWF281_004870 [Arthrobotrys megalospora]